MTLAIGVDVGGTKIAAGVVDDTGNVLAELRSATPATDVEATELAIVDLIAQLRRDHDVAHVGVGAAGWVDAKRSVVYYAPNLAWRDEHLGEELSESCGIQVVIENDGNAAAWGEYRFGAGVGFEDVVCVTVGTGIGGGMVLGGSIYRGGFGISAEFGHVRVVPDGLLCPCGNHGCWEQYASGRALVRTARELAAADRGRAETLLSLGDGTPQGIQGVHVTAAAEDGDTVALDAFDEVGRWLGQGLADLVAVLDPSCLIIGGGVSDAGELILDPARAAYESAVTGRGHRPFAELRLAEHANNAGLVGAADLARNRP
jgi:glucokinase